MRYFEDIRASDAGAAASAGVQFTIQAGNEIQKQKLEAEMKVQITEMEVTER